MLKLISSDKNLLLLYKGRGQNRPLIFRLLSSRQFYTITTSWRQDVNLMSIPVLYGVPGFLTNDKVFEWVKGIDILLPDKFLKS